MFRVNSSFYKFFETIQSILKAEYHLEALSPSACHLYAEQPPISFVYYLSDASHRHPIAGDRRCLHIDQDLWINKTDCLTSRIKSLAGQAHRIHARDTVAARIDKAMAMEFQVQHHLQVALPGKYRYGLFLNGELVSIATFSGGRKKLDQPEDYRSYELLRFCHKQGYHVIGGFSKLLDIFHEEHQPDDIMTYADKDWTDGATYQKLGFEEVGVLEPQAFWIDINRMKRYTEGTIPEALIPLSDEERKAKGFYKHFNSGSIKYIKTFHA
jgi:hypothetical protein